MSSTTLTQGSLIPHFTVTTIDGHRVRYADLWQRRNLVLFALSEPPGPAERAHVAEVSGRVSVLQPDDTTVLAYAAEAARPTLAIADRWGEIVYVRDLSGAASTWPPPEEVVDWVNFVRSRCPECPP